MALSAIFLVALSLSMDCFAVALAGSVSMQRLSYKQVVRASFAFGFFQAGMLVLGWLVGQAVVDIIAGYAYWVAFVLLGLVGVRMIWESLSSGSESRQHTDITKGFALLTLSIATSIDALAVGLGLALLESRILLAVIVVGLVTAGRSCSGCRSSVFGCTSGRSGRSLRCRCRR